MAPRPAEPVEYWIGASARVSIDRAARIADGWLASPGLTIDQAREQAAWYLTAAPSTGRSRRRWRSGGTSTWASRRPRRTRWARPWSRRGIAASTRRRSAGARSTQVVEKFRALEPLGYTDIIVRHLTDDHAKVLGSLARLAEVRKALQNA